MEKFEQNLIKKPNKEKPLNYKKIIRSAELLKLQDEKRAGQKLETEDNNDQK